MVGTGWWCDGSGGHAGSRQKHLVSSSFNRSPDFFPFWHSFVDRYTDPVQIVVVDSASPVRPNLPEDSRIQFLSMAKNFGSTPNSLHIRSTLSNLGRTIPLIHAPTS